MAKVKGPLMSLEASGTIGGAIVFDKRNIVRVHKVPANPRTAAQMAVRNKLADIQAELKQLGLLVRADVKTDLGYRWNSVIIQELTANDQAVYDAHAAVFAAFDAGDITAWEDADPGVGLNGTVGETFYCVAKALFDVDQRAGGDGAITEPIATNAAAVAAEWIADA